MNIIHSQIIAGINEIQVIHSNLISFTTNGDKNSFLIQITQSLDFLKDISLQLNNKNIFSSIENIKNDIERLKEDNNDKAHYFVSKIHNQVNKIEEEMLSIIDNTDSDTPIWEKIKEVQLDVLKEIGNIGAGHSATALSQMLGKTIDMKVPKVSLLSFNEISEAVGGDEHIVVTVLLTLKGDITGNMFFILEEENAKRFVSSMMGQSKESVGFSEIELSAIQEVGNILSASYLNAISDLTNLNLQPSVPLIAIDMATAVLGYGLIEVGKIGDYALVIDTTFIDVEDNRNINGHFFLLPDPDAFEKLFHSLGVPFNE